jgi:hypothetical protein
MRRDPHALSIIGVCTIAVAGVFFRRKFEGRGSSAMCVRFGYDNLVVEESGLLRLARDRGF